LRSRTLSFAYASLNCVAFDGDDGAADDVFRRRFDDGGGGGADAADDADDELLSSESLSPAAAAAAAAASIAVADFLRVRLDLRPPLPFDEASSEGDFFEFDARSTAAFFVDAVGALSGDDATAGVGVATSALMDVSISLFQRVGKGRRLCSTVQRRVENECEGEAEESVCAQGVDDVRGNGKSCEAAAATSKFEAIVGR
jgi:hypothetical protein